MTEDNKDQMQEAAAVIAKPARKLTRKGKLFMALTVALTVGVTAAYAVYFNQPISGPCVACGMG